MITIIDYKSGNLRSISNSFKKIGSEAIITDDPSEIANAKHLVLPGVGAFGTAMENIEPFKDVIYEHIDDGKPFLGICLGLQVLLSSSDEAPGVKGRTVRYWKVLTAGTFTLCIHIMQCLMMLRIFQQQLIMALM